MNSEICDALMSAGAGETRARETAKSVAQYGRDIGELRTSLADIKTSLRVIQWMFGSTLAFVVALTWRAFRQPMPEGGFSLVDAQADRGTRLRQVVDPADPRRQRRFCAVLLALFVAVSAPQAAHAEETRGTAEEAQVMVANAIAHYDEMGAEAAIATFNDAPAPRFRDRDLYIFVLDSTGMTLAHGVDQSLVGVNVTGVKDVDGKRFGVEMVESATSQGVWVSYKWSNPVTGAAERKSSWVVRHDDHIFGVGIYEP